MTQDKKNKFPGDITVFVCSQVLYVIPPLDSDLFSFAKVFSSSNETGVFNRAKNSAICNYRRRCIKNKFSFLQNYSHFCSRSCSRFHLVLSLAVTNLNKGLHTYFNISIIQICLPTFIITLTIIFCSYNCYL